MGNHHSDNESSLYEMHYQDISNLYCNQNLIPAQPTSYSSSALQLLIKQENAESASKCTKHNKKLISLKIDHTDQSRRHSVPSICFKIGTAEDRDSSKQDGKDRNNNKCIAKSNLQYHKTSVDSKNSGRRFSVLKQFGEDDYEHNSLLPNSSMMPTIQINGKNEPNSPPLLERKALPDQSITPSTTNIHQQRNESTIYKQRAQKMDSRKMTAHRRLERTSANQRSQKRRLDFLAGTSVFAARSLDEASGSHVHFATDLQLAMMKPLNVCHQNSPLKQMRTYSNKSVAEENVISKEDGEEIRKSWKLANDCISKFTNKRSFGFFVFETFFEKAPKLKELFGITEGTIYDLPDEHPFNRHTRIFDNILDLSVRNVNELETEIAPALFTYGKRHYQQKMVDIFNEEVVRMFCGEIVHAMLEILGDELTTEGFEAWIEMVRYMGTVLLNGFEYERLAKTKKISINTKQHAYFML